MNEIKHTPLPWVVTADGMIFHESANDLLADTFPMLEGDQMANAEFIVRACNAHYEMLEALRNFETAYSDDDLLQLSKTESGMGEISPYRANAYIQVRAAIAKATLS